MSKQKLHEQETKNGKPMWVIQRHNATFSVFDAVTPGIVYMVTFAQNGTTCTCPASDDAGDCIHIRAIRDQERVTPASVNGSGKDAESSNGHQLTLKRSVSPDGRIDSLSIELAGELNDATAAGVQKQAETWLAIQRSIATHFLDKGENGVEPEDSEGFVSARMLNVGGMNTRYGWRHFIVFEVGNGQYRMFGTKKQLGECLSDAGFEEHANRISTGYEFNLPCRVRLEPSEDGRYQNVQELRSASVARENGGRRNG